MNTKYIIGLIFLLSLFMTACNDDKEIFFDDVIGEETLDRVHPNTRDKPYPREEHILYINPTPLIVPESAKKEEEFLEFELSQNENFPAEGTYRSEKLNCIICIKKWLLVTGIGVFV